MDDEDFGEFGIARKKIVAKDNFAIGEFGQQDQRVRDSDNVRFTIGLGMEAISRMVEGR